MDNSRYTEKVTDILKSFVKTRDFLMRKIWSVSTTFFIITDHIKIIKRKSQIKKRFKI